MPYRTLLLSLAVVATGLSACTPETSQDALPASPAPPAPAVEERIARIERSLIAPLQLEGEPTPTQTLGELMAATEVPALALAIVDDCSVVWSGGWGTLEADGETAVTGSTPFQVGSVSKAVTATLAMILAAEGELDLDRPVNDLLRTWRLPDNDLARETPVLVRHLLAHSAGLTRTAYWFERGAALPSIPALLGGEAGNPAIAVEEAPGSRAVPSNSGFLLLQNILEDVTGIPLARLADSRLFTPTGMSDSAFEPVDEAFLARATTGHRRDGTAMEGKAPLIPAAPGGLWSSAEDLGRLLAELMKSWQGRSERLLPREMTRRMLSPQLDGMGLGLHLRGEGEDFSFQQAGGGIGSQSRLIAYPERCQGAVVVINTDRGRRLIAETLAAVGQEYDWPDLPLRRAKIQLDAEALQRFAGRYEYDAAPGNFLTFFVEGDDLLARARRDPFPVFPVSETVVVAPLNASEMRFHFDAEGQAVRVTIGTAGLYGSHLRRVAAAKEM